MPTRRTVLKWIGVVPLIPLVSSSDLVCAAKPSPDHDFQLLAHGEIVDPCILPLATCDDVWDIQGTWNLLAVLTVGDVVNLWSREKGTTKGLITGVQHYKEWTFVSTVSAPANRRARLWFHATRGVMRV